MGLFGNVVGNINEAVEAGEEYLEATKEYYELKAFQQITVSISVLVKLALVGILIVLAFIFMGIAAAIGIGEYLENMAQGYLVVSLILFIFAIITYASRKLIIKKVLNKISHEFNDE